MTAKACSSWPERSVGRYRAREGRRECSIAASLGDSSHVCTCRLVRWSDWPGGSRCGTNTRLETPMRRGPHEASTVAHGDRHRSRARLGGERMFERRRHRRRQRRVPTPKLLAVDEFGTVEIAADEPISIGTLLVISGADVALGQDSQNGAVLASDYLDGTFDGTDGSSSTTTSSWTHEDDLCSAEGGQAGATALAADPSIVAVIGTSCSSAALGRRRHDLRPRRASCCSRRRTRTRR